MYTSTQAHKHIAFGADFRYADQVMTTVKSVCCYNRNICFHLLNRDFPSEWFASLNRHLKHFDSEIRDIKIDNGQIGKYPTLPHIASESTYFRYFIPKVINAERVLYLDCDLVVNGDLSFLFEGSLGDYPLAAVTDIIHKLKHPKNNLQFNAGVMLIDTAAWKTIGLPQAALALSEQIIDKLPDGDQSILNILFAGKWLPLHRNCNYQVGMDWLLSERAKLRYIENLNGIIPLIVHYNTKAKPWLDGEHTRFRDLYHRYRNLDWQEIIRGQIG